MGDCFKLQNVVDAFEVCNFIVTVNTQQQQLFPWIFDPHWHFHHSIGFVFIHEYDEFY